MDDQNCLFCKIVAGRLPAHKVYEDDSYLAFLDIHPFTFGHVLVIPKKHHRWVYDVSDFSGFWDIAKLVSSAQIKTLNSDYISFLTFGLLVPHAHIHVVPRLQNDGQGEGIDVKKRLNPTPSELSLMASSIKKNIQP